MALKLEIVPAGCGDKWDDQSLGEVVGFAVYHNSLSLFSLRFIYVKNKVQQISKAHGNVGGKCEMVVLDYPTEFFIEVHGYYLDRVIKAITFVSNKATYGPFGPQRNAYGSSGTEFGFKFSVKEPRGWISGFYGTVYNDNLDSLGVYVQAPSYESENDEL